MADDRPFQNTGHSDQPFDLGQVQTHSQWTREHSIIFGEVEFFSRDLADQRESIGSDLSQQQPEQFHRSTYLHAHPQYDRLSLFREADERNVPSPLDGSRQFALVPQAIAGDAPRDNPTPLSEKVSQQPDIFEIDRPFINTKPARPSALEKPSTPTAFSVSALLFTLHKPSPSLLDMLVGFIPGIIVHRRLSSSTTAILAFRHERHRLGYNLMLAALLAVFRFPSALLQPPIDDDPIPLAEILPAMFRLLAKDHYVDKTDFFLQFIALLVPPADRETQTGHGCPVRRVSQLRIPREVPEKNDFIKPGHQQTPPMTFPAAVAALVLF